MGFYKLSKQQRKEFVDSMRLSIISDLDQGTMSTISKYSSSPDTYVRKNVYQILARLYRGSDDYKMKILFFIDKLLVDPHELKRQTAVYACCEIGVYDAETVLGRLERVLVDGHHRVRNALTGGLKRMADKNPVPSLQFAKKHIHHKSSAVRCVIIHGIELRGRKHPEDILPLLQELQNDSDKKVRKILVHVLGQISYKKGCL